MRRLRALILAFGAIILIALAVPAASATTQSDVDIPSNPDRELSSAEEAMFERNLAKLPDDVARDVQAEGRITFWLEGDMIDIFPCAPLSYTFPPNPGGIMNTCESHSAVIYRDV